MGVEVLTPLQIPPFGPDGCFENSKTLCKGGSVTVIKRVSSYHVLGPVLSTSHAFAHLMLRTPKEVGTIIIIPILQM